MKPILGWDETPAYTGETMQLPKGLYVCIVKQANIVEAKDGREQLALLFDIVEGDQKGFYQKQFDSRKRSGSDVKWSGVYKQFTRTKEDAANPFFKGVICSIEKSNNGYRWDWNEKSLVGKRFGGIFGRKQFLTNSGEKRMTTILKQIRSVEGLKDAEIPEDELLPEGPAAAAPAPMDPAHPLGGGDGFINIPDGIDEELPFM